MTHLNEDAYEVEKKEYKKKEKASREVIHDIQKKLKVLLFYDRCSKARRELARSPRLLWSSRRDTT